MAAGVSIKAYSGAGMAFAFSGAAYGDTDSTAVNLGTLTPGGVVSEYDIYWYNEGDDDLTGVSVSFVAHPTSDSGDAEDTTDVMAFYQNSGTGLGYGTAATNTNTASWSGEVLAAWDRGPLPDPFLGSGADMSCWKCGIRWAPPADATAGYIRKAVRWTGTYS